CGRRSARRIGRWTSASRRVLSYDRADRYARAQMAKLTLSIGVGDREALRAYVAARIKLVEMNPKLKPETFDVTDVIEQAPGLAGRSKVENDEIRGALRFFLGQKLDFVPRPDLSNEAHELLLPCIRSLVYWDELDD